MKKTNELPPVPHSKDSKDKDTKDGTTVVKEESPDASPQRMRTRNKAAKEQTTSRSSRPKRGGTETPEPKTPSKINANSPAAEKNSTPNTPAKKKGKSEKQETPNKTRKRAQEKVEDIDLDEKDLGIFKKKRERAEVTNTYSFESYSNLLSGILIICLSCKSPSSVTTDSGSINDEVDNNETEQETNDSNTSLPQPSNSLSAVPNSNNGNNNGNNNSSNAATSTVTTPSSIVTDGTTTTSTAAQKIVKIENDDRKLTPSPVSVPSSNNNATTLSMQQQQSTKPLISESPLNVSIRLPDDINERKNLIKRNIEHSNELKDIKFSTEVVKFNSDVKKDIKIENPPIKTEKDVKEEIVDNNIPEKFKTELIIPKVIAMDKVIIKEEQESSNEAINMNVNSKEEAIYKENLFMPQNMIKEPTLTFGSKEQHLNNHLPPNHPIIMKEAIDRGKEMNLNQPYMKEQQQQMKVAEQFSPYQSKEMHPLNTVVKMEPRDEPIELTNSNKSEMYNNQQQQPPPPLLGPQPLNIPTVIPISSQQRPQDHFDDTNNEKRMDRNDKLERPERLDRPDLTNMMGTSIGQPPIPSLMQSGNLVTIGGGQQSINPYSYIPPPSHYNPHSPRNVDKSQMSQMQQMAGPQLMQQAQPNGGLSQNEPQNLKIKQEIPDSMPVNPPHVVSALPPYSQNIPPTNMSMSVSAQNPQQHQQQPQMVQQQIGPLATMTPTNLGQSGYPNQPMNSVIDPLQSLKDVKVPGYNIQSNVVPSQQQSSGGVSSNSNDRPSSGPTIIDNIKKEPDYNTSSNQMLANSPAPPPQEKSPAPKNSTPTPRVSISQTPPLHQQGIRCCSSCSSTLCSCNNFPLIVGASPQPNMAHSAINLISPSSIIPVTSQPNHPSQQPGHPFNGSMPPPHPLIHASLFTHMHQFHPHPYSAYPFSYPYPYGPMPQPHPHPHPIPPQQTISNSRPDVKSSVESSTTMLSSQHSSSSSSLTARREVREMDGNGEERHQMHETTLTQRQSTSHHSAVHSSTDPQGFGGGSQSITISHTTSTSSSQSLQHKINQKTVRTASPHASQQSSSTSLNHSATTSNHQHTHHHTHHHERLSPGNQLLNMRQMPHTKPPQPQTNPHHLMIQPPSMGHHGPPLGKNQILNYVFLDKSKLIVLLPLNFRTSGNG